MTKSGQELRAASALVRYHLGIDPDTLSDLQFGKIFNELIYVLEIEARRNGNS